MEAASVGGLFHFKPSVRCRFWHLAGWVIELRQPVHQNPPPFTTKSQKYIISHALPCAVPFEFLINLKTAKALSLQHSSQTTKVGTGAEWIGHE